jgi:hypothetical protein
MLSLVALLAGWFLLGRVRDESGAFPRALFAVGIAFAVIGFVLLWLGARG